MSSGKKKKSGQPQATGVGKGKPWWLVVLIVAVVTWVLFQVPSEKVSPPSSPGSDPSTAGVGPAKKLDLGSDEEVFGQYAGSESCRDCHGTVFVAWEKSNHGLAERNPHGDFETAAFGEPKTFKHGTQTTSVFRTNGNFFVETLGLKGKTNYRVERVIGEEPLRQYLVSAPGGRLQTLETAFDPHRGEWFDVYGDEDRQPGEWGHWTGRGMTWNSMCASCHNTRLRKHYDTEKDAYQTSMAEMSVGCEACHGPMKDHVDWQKAASGAGEKDPTIKKFDPNRILDSCAACHSRRSELTGDFKPGDAYVDHFSLLLPNESDIYYPDGQVRGENYVYGSFLSSGMHAAGVRCKDCHDPHSNKTLLPGNLLCMRCHNGSFPNSPVIDPAAHSFHKVEGKGGQCVNCHMPQTTYMQRHPRRDHGFTIPDPLLTKELGIPNACNRCHEDKDTDWAIAAVDKWYGPRMERRTRERARWIASARAGEPEARDRLLTLLDEEKSPFWQAVAAGMLDPWAHEPRVTTALVMMLEHENPMVRSSAAQTLETVSQMRLPNVERTLRRLLDDPVRSVRVQAAWALRHMVGPDQLASQELVHYLDHNADQPTGLLQKGVYHLSRGDVTAALAQFSKAVEWDPNSAPLRHEYGVVLSMQGNVVEALQQVQEACRLEPDVAEYQYKLGLAWNEAGGVKESMAALERAVALDQRHARAWYNLGLSRNRAQDFDGAIDALLKAESVSENDPRIPYATATILVRLGRDVEARAAAQRALDISPDYEPARAFLR